MADQIGNLIRSLDEGSNVADEDFFRGGMVPESALQSVQQEPEQVTGGLLGMFTNAGNSIMDFFDREDTAKAGQSPMAATRAKSRELARKRRAITRSNIAKKRDKLRVPQSVNRAMKQDMR